MHCLYSRSQISTIIVTNALGDVGSPIKSSQIAYTRDAEEATSGTKKALSPGFRYYDLHRITQLERVAYHATVETASRQCAVWLFDSKLDRILSAS